MQYPDLHYECLHCGYSCRTFEVEVSLLEAARVRGLGGSGAVESRGGRHWLRRDRCGDCHFYSAEPEGGCALHAQHSAAAKPQRCQDFPFRAVSTEVGVFVGASFACQAIAESYGPAVGAQQMATLQPRQLKPVPLAPGLPFNPRTYARWEALLTRRLRDRGEAGLRQAALELAAEVGPPTPPAKLTSHLEVLFGSTLALAEGPWTAPGDERRLDALLTAHAERGVYSSAILGADIDFTLIRSRWETPWSRWGEVRLFFEHLLFRKYLLEGPDVISRVCSLPTLVDILQLLCLARWRNLKSDSQQGTVDIGWALRQLEQRLTFHARGLEAFLGHFGDAYLDRFEL